MPDWRAYVRSKLPPLDIPPERELDIVDELALQLEAAYDAAIARGATDEEARAAAFSEIRDWRGFAATLGRIERRSRDARRATAAATSQTTMMSGLTQDIRHAVRRLLHAPSYSAIAVATLALGLALGTVAFSLIDGILLRPLAYPASGRLVLVKATVPPEGRETVEITYPDAQDLAKESAGVESLSAVLPYAGTTISTDPPSRIEGFEVSGNLFATLGVTTSLGRLLTRDDEAPGAPPVAVIGNGYWERMGSPGDIVGRTLAINEIPRTIVGVAPRGFRIDLLALPADVFVPLTSLHPFAMNRSIRAFRVIARLRDGVAIETASSAMGILAARLAQAYPDSNRGRSFRVHPLQEEIVGPVRSQLWLLAGLVALVLLIAAVNLAGLLLTRAMSRMREMAVRVSLGAGRWHLVRESMAEGLVISFAGAAGGAIGARWILEALRVAPGLVMPRLAEVQVDWRAASALGAAAAIIACGAGIAPLTIMRRVDATGALRTGHETAGRPAIRLRSALIAGQTAFAFVLLAAAVLLASSLGSVLAQPLGFETSQVVTMRVAVPEKRYASREDTIAFYTELVDTLRAQPSIKSAGLVSTLPLAGSTGSTLTVYGRESVPMAMRPTVGWQWASPGYFSTMGIPIVSGRDFTPADLTRAPHVTVINETLARLHFAGEDPIGKRVYFGGYAGATPPEWHEVIGIAGDVRHRTLEAEPDARAYDLFGQHWGRTVSLAVRSADRPLQIVGVVRHVLAARDARLAVFSIRSGQDLVDGAAATRRLLVWIVAAFASIGLLVSVIGLYGTLSYVVAQRTREVGVRLALGATGADIRRLIVRRGMQLATAGLVIGLLLAVPLERVVEEQLFDARSLMLPSLAAAAIALLIAALVACLAPAARAVRVNPVEALRAE